MDLTKLDFNLLRDNKEYRKSAMSHDLLEQFTTELGKIKVYKNPDGKVNATVTRDNLTTLQGHVSKFVHDTTRGNFYTGKDTQTGKPTLGKLTPIALYALRRDQGVAYEQWDKEDPAIISFIGKDLKDILLHLESNVFYEDITENDPMDLRNHYTNNGAKSNTTWPAKAKYNTITQVPGIIYSQIWLANASIRKDSMILDLHDWDNMPEALDETAKVPAVLEDNSIGW